MIILSSVSLLLNAIALILFFVFAYRKKKKLFLSALCALGIGTFALLIYLALKGIAAKACPSLLSPLTYAFFALLIYLLYFLVAFKFQIRLLAVFMVPVAFLFQSLSFFSYRLEVVRQTRLYLAVVGLHTGMLMLGQALFVLAFASALMYLVQAKNLKSRRFNQWFRRLPSLGKLEEMAAFGILAGFPFMTVGILVGIVWAEKTWSGSWYLAPEIIWSTAAWLVFSWLFYGRVAKKLEGRRFLVLVIWGFLFMLMSYFFTSSFGSVHGEKNASARVDDRQSKTHPLALPRTAKIEPILWHSLALPKSSLSSGTSPVDDLGKVNEFPCAFFGKGQSQRMGFSSAIGPCQSLLDSI